MTAGIAPPALFVLFSWWFSTGAILVVDGLPRRTFRASFLVAGGLMLAALGVLLATSGSTTPGAAYAAFAAALVVWGWHEMAFLMGFVTGPRKVACPPGAAGWERFRCATAAVIHHELALAATLVAIALITSGGANQVGTYTFLVLWAMRLSAKVNLFLGVRNLATDFIPDNLRYLLTYFRRSKLNPLMPFSIVIGGALVVRLAGKALAAPAGSFEQTSGVLVATILALAVLEHLFLTVPVPDALLWRWAMPRKPVDTPEEAP